MKTLQKDRLFVEVPKIRDGQEVAINNRPATPEEADAALEHRRKLAVAKEARSAVNRQIQELEDQCPHVVCYDTPGFPYDTRQCAGCDKDKGLV